MQNNNAAKFVFFYMLSLVALIFMALSTGMIIFQIINKNIVDIINEYKGRFSEEQLKFAISALVISTPIFYITTKQIFKNIYSGMLEKNSGVRKWLTYLILFISSVVMLGWLIGTINSFLDGDLTTKFILKAVTSIGISAIVFTFYFYDIKREEVVEKKDNIIRIYFYGSLAIVLAVFVSSLFFVESPKETRNRKIDESILNNFETINNEVDLYYQNYKKMPDNLDILREKSDYLTDKNLEDPETKIKFEYKITGDKNYELCANFRTSNKEDDTDIYSYIRNNWKHDAGYQCLKGRQVEKNIENVK